MFLISTYWCIKVFIVLNLRGGDVNHFCLGQSWETDLSILQNLNVLYKYVAMKCVFSYLSSEMYISIHFMQQAASFLFLTLHRVKMSKVTCELIIFNKAVAC